MAPLKDFPSLKSLRFNLKAKYLTVENPDQDIMDFLSGCPKLESVRSSLDSNDKTPFNLVNLIKSLN